VKIVVDASQVAYVDLRQIKTAINRQLIEHLHLSQLENTCHIILMPSIYFKSVRYLAHNMSQVF